MAWCAARRITVLRESRSSSTLRARQLRQCKPASRRWVTRSRLRGQGLRRAVLGTAGFSAVAALVLGTKAMSVVEPAVAWIIGGFGVFVVFWLARHFLRMAFQSIRRGILNQHVLIEFGALAGLVGGVLGLILRRPDYPTAQFFAVHRELPHLLGVAVPPGQDAQLPGRQATARPAARHGARGSG